MKPGGYSIAWPALIVRSNRVGKGIHVLKLGAQGSSEGSAVCGRFGGALPAGQLPVASAPAQSETAAWNLYGPHCMVNTRLLARHSAVFSTAKLHSMDLY